MDLKDAFALLVILVSVASTIMVSGNARRATTVQAENVDLSRIRDLRAELAETKIELDACRQQATELNRKLQIANREAGEAWTEVAVLRRMAYRPGMTIERLREYLGPLIDDEPRSTASG